MIKQTTRNKVLAALLSNVNNCVSGQELANGLNISRTAINTHISKLITNGFDIEKIHGHGYRLTHIPDSITEPVMQHFMEENKDDFQFIYHKSVTSTNLLAKNLADQGQVAGTVIVADEQTKGRGRLGRTWHSESMVGLWMSVILRPALLARDAGKITLLTALAVNSSIRELTSINNTMIKWPNDILSKDMKKLCGILTEMSADIDGVTWVVVGIGINMKKPTGGYPKEIENTATSVEKMSGQQILRASLACKILKKLQKYILLWEQEGFTVIMDEYRKYMAFIGKDVVISTHKYKQYGKLIGVNDEGELLLKDDDHEKTIVSGEVSLRLNKEGAL